MAAILRLLRPGLWVGAFMVVLSLVARHGRALGLPLGAVNAAAVAFFVLLVSAPLLLYPVAFFRGFRPAARIVAARGPAPSGPYGSAEPQVMRRSAGQGRSPAPRDQPRATTGYSSTAIETVDPAGA
jgi:hypothetical protein